MDALGGDSFQNFFHTSTWNVVNNEVFHCQNPLIRPSSSTANRCQFRQLEDHLVKPASSGSKGTTKLNPCFSPWPCHCQKTQGFGILIFSQAKNWHLCSDFQGDIFKNVDFRNQVACHLSGPRRITWRIPCLELFCSAQLDNKQSSIGNICQMNLSSDLANLNHPFGTDIKASLPCQPNITHPPWSLAGPPVVKP